MKQPELAKGIDDLAKQLHKVEREERSLLEQSIPFSVDWSATPIFTVRTP